MRKPERRRSTLGKTHEFGDRGRQLQVAAARDGLAREGRARRSCCTIKRNKKSRSLVRTDQKIGSRRALHRGRNPKAKKSNCKSKMSF